MTESVPEVSKTSQHSLPDPPKRRRVEEKEEKEVSLEDFNITAEKQAAAMKMFYDFSGEAVVIPEEARNRRREAPATQDKEQARVMGLSLNELLPFSSQQLWREMRTNLRTESKN